MIHVLPQSFTKVSYDADQIALLAQRSLEGVAALPDDLDVHLEIGEEQATNRMRVESLSPVTLVVDGGAIENYKQPRTLGELESLISFTRLLLEVADRLSTSFAGPAIGDEVALAERMAWDVNLFGRTSRHGLRIHKPRYLYNFRNRHGFTDRADRAFDELWAADDLTWAQIVEISHRATDPVDRSTAS